MAVHTADGGAGGTWRLATALMWVLWAPTARADDARYQNVLVGARAAGLGGAYTALADDASGLIYNPAGIVDVKRANLSVSTSLYGFERQSRGGNLSGLPLTGLPQISSGDINIIPSTAGSVMGLGELMPDGAHRHAVSFGLMVPSLRTAAINEDTTGNVREGGFGARRNLRLLDRQLWAGVGYGYRLGERVRIGLAVHYVLRTIDAVDGYTLATWAQGQGATIRTVETDLKLQSGSAVGVLGTKLYLVPQFMLGLSVTTQSLQLHHNGSYRVRRTNADRRDVSYDAVDRTINEGPLANLGNVGTRTPFQGRLGVAWVERADWTLCADLVAYLPVEYQLVPDDGDIDDSQIPLATRVRRQTVVNGAVGYERLVGRSLSFAVGLFTNLPSSPPMDVGGDGVLLKGSSRLPRVPTVGLTFAAGQLSSFSLTRVGFASTFGVGEAVAVKDRAAVLGDKGSVQFERFTATEWTFYMFLSSTFRYGEGKSERMDFGLPDVAKVLGG